MEWVETTGKTLEEAKDAALDRLGIDHDEAEFQVLEEPRPGLFGRVRGEARVRARVAPRAPRPKQDRRERRRGSGSRERGGGSSASAAPASGDRPTADATARRSSRSRRPSGGATPAAGAPDGGVATEVDAPDAAPVAASVGDDTAVAATDTPPRTAAPRRRGGGRSRGAAAPAADTAADQETAPEPGDAGTTQEEPTMTITLDEQTALAEQFLTGLVAAFGLEATLETSRVDESTAEIDLVGDDLGLLIGPRGNTISSLQELTRIVLQKEAGGSYEGRVRVDVGGYRQRRREALARFTEQVAEQVRTSGARKALEPMSAADRKVVHDTVNELEGVHTLSEGEEPRRWVVIAPND